MTDYPNEQFDEWLDALGRGEGYYLECPEAHGWLPPRRVCPECGATELSETPLPSTGVVRTYTVTQVASPSFAEDTPYVTAIVDFDPVELTGMVRGVDHDDVAIGMVVGATAGDRVTTDDRLVEFRPR
jgi:uncharacterized OB-fold protein